MLNEIIVTNPNAIVDGSDEDLLANLEYLELENPETLSAKMQLVREKNKVAIAAVLSPNIRVMTSTKTLDQFQNYLSQFDIVLDNEYINYIMATKP